jgi:1,4-dihydroxy-2-naphthoate octaprenyltransferase
VIVGSALAAHADRFCILPALICLIFALLAQIAANFANDYFDFVKGADNGERTGPRRAVASGLVAPKTMRLATVIVCVAAFLTGLALLPYGGWPLLVIGIASILSAIAYTGGPFPLAYLGLGDLFVFVFFGLIAVCATAYVQAGFLAFSWFVPASSVGILTANILLANNYRDADTDAPAGKKTLVVRFGCRFARIQFATAHLLALVCPLYLALHWHLSAWPLLILLPPLAVWAWFQVRTLARSREPRELIALLGSCGQYLAVYSVVFSVWLLLFS